MNEDTRVVVTELAFGVFALVMNVRLLRALREGFGWTEFDVRSATVGAIETTCYTYVAEHEPVVSKLERPSGELAFFFLHVVSRRFVPRGVSSEDSASIGNGVGCALSSRLRGCIRSPRGTLAPMVLSVVVVGNVTRSLASRGLDSPGTGLTSGTAGRVERTTRGFWAVSPEHRYGYRTAGARRSPPPRPGER